MDAPLMPTHTQESPLRAAATLPASGVFRPSRWYDAYANLSMGLHLLFLAPSTTQPRLVLLLLNIIKSQLGMDNEQLKAILTRFQGDGLSKQRWYDAIPYLTFALELLKTLPPSQIRKITKQWHQQFGDFLSGEGLPSIASV